MTLPRIDSGAVFPFNGGAMKSFFWRWVILMVAVFVAGNIRFLGIDYDNWGALVVAAFVLGIVNTVVRPVLLVIGLPLIVLSLGVFVLIINALLFFAVGKLVSGFHVASFWSAMGGSMIVSLVSMLLGTARPSARGEGRYYVRRGPPPGKGPIIDV